ncbi:hypothetical protein HN51_047092 [Arachis hypogaea]
MLILKKIVGFKSKVKKENGGLQKKATERESGKNERLEARSLPSTTSKKQTATHYHSWRRTERRAERRFGRRTSDRDKVDEP